MTVERYLLWNRSLNAFDIFRCRSINVIRCNEFIRQSGFIVHNARFSPLSGACNIIIGNGLSYALNSIWKAAKNRVICLPQVSVLVNTSPCLIRLSNSVIDHSDEWTVILHTFHFHEIINPQFTKFGGIFHLHHLSVKYICTLKKRSGLKCVQ